MQRRAASNAFADLKIETLQAEYMKPKPTGLLGFREFTFDRGIEHGIRSNVQN